MKLIEIFLLPPSRLIKYIWGCGHDRFTDSILGKDCELGLKTFWDAACDWEPYRMHPVLAELDPSERGKLIPMSFR